MPNNLGVETPSGYRGHTDEERETFDQWREFVGQSGMVTANDDDDNKDQQQRDRNGQAGPEEYPGDHHQRTHQIFSESVKRNPQVAGFYAEYALDQSACGI